MPKLFDPKLPDGFVEVEHINGYLLAAPDIYVEPRATPFFRVPEMRKGSTPIDDGNFLLTPEERDELVKKKSACRKVDSTVSRLAGIYSQH